MKMWWLEREASRAAEVEMGEDCGCRYKRKEVRGERNNGRLEGKRGNE